MTKAVLKRLFGFFCDQDGTSSMTRLGCFLLLVTWCALALLKRGIPDNTPAFAEMLIGFYGANCLRNAVQSFAKKNGPEQ